MRKQDFLPGLIASLGPNEKRYFKLFSGLQPGEKRYLKLFDALENKEKYDGAELCAELGLEAWQLADDKHYLTQTLLQSLRNYDNESTELSILRNNKENAQSLINRRMFGFAIDLIEKTMSRAWELESFEIIDALLILRNSCWQNLGILPANDDTLEKHNMVSARLQEIIEMVMLRSQARKLEINAAPPAQFKKTLEHQLIKRGVAKLHSIRAKSLWFETLSHYNSAIIDVDALLRLAHEEQKLYIRHPEIKIINPIVYLTSISRIASGGNDFEMRQEMVKKLRQELLNPEIKISAQRRESILWSADLISLWNLRYLYRFKEALPIAEKTYKDSGKRSEYDRFSITFEYALLLLHNGKAPLAADKIDELLRFKSNVRLDMQPFVRLLHVLAQLEIGNYTLIPDIIKSARFWLKQKESGHAEVSLLLKHAGLIAKAPGNKKEAWKALLGDTENGKLQTIKQLLQLDEWVKNIIKKIRG